MGKSSGRKWIPVPPSHYTTRQDLEHKELFQLESSLRKNKQMRVSQQPTESLVLLIGVIGLRSGRLREMIVSVIEE